MNNAHSGYHPAQLEMATYDEADRACAAYNAPMGWTREEADRIILASIVSDRLYGAIPCSP